MKSNVFIFRGSNPKIACLTVSPRMLVADPVVQEGLRSVAVEAAGSALEGRLQHDGADVLQGQAPRQSGGAANPATVKVRHEVLPYLVRPDLAVAQGAL